MSAALPRSLMSCILLRASLERRLGWDLNGQADVPHTRMLHFELHFSSTKARLEKAGDCWCVSLLPCSRLKSRSVPSKPKCAALSPASGKLTSRIEDVREEWHSNHLCNSPAASFLSSPVTLAHCCNPGRMSGSALQCYFPRLWDGGEKRINKRISVMVPAFGGKWSILSAAVIRFCGSQKDFLFHSCISSGMTESLAFRTCFLVWRSKSHIYPALLHSVKASCTGTSQTSWQSSNSWDSLHAICSRCLSPPQWSKVSHNDLEVTAFVMKIFPLDDG